MERHRDPHRMTDEVGRDARANEAARRAVLRQDAERSLGENLEQADVLIKAVQELRDAFRRP